jgi:hydrogenase maturation protease
MTGASDILVVGVGNLLLRDDGVGIHAIHALQADPPPGVTLLDAGTAILHALPFVAAAGRVLVIDAARGGKPPGSIYLFEGVAGVPEDGLSSLHALGLREAMRVLDPETPMPPVTVVGVEPENMDYGMELTVDVAAALPRVVGLVRRLVAEWSPALAGAGAVQ